MSGERQTLVVVGIGADGAAGLSPEARAHVARAELLAGGKRQLDYFLDFAGPRVVLEGDLRQAIAQLQANRTQRCVVLASGDPLYFGIGKLLLEHFEGAELQFVPHVSSVQLAFARIKQSWHDARVVSLHGRPLDALRAALAEDAGKIALFTDAHNTPAAIARVLRENDRDFTIWVCENLGGPEERVRSLPRDEVERGTFAPLNLVVLINNQASVRRPDAPGAPGLLPCLGLADDAFRSEPAGMITRREVRLIALGYLELHEKDVLWDIGAGSGSVSIEASRLLPSLRVFAVERSAAALEQARANAAALGANGITFVEGTAPDVLHPLPDPGAVFLGGSGGKLEEILDVVIRRLRPGGRLVVNCVTLENFTRAWDWLTQLGWQPAVTQVQLAHSGPLGRYHAFESDRPVFIIRASRPTP